MEKFYLDIGNTHYKMAVFGSDGWSVIASGRIGKSEEFKLKMRVVTSKDSLIISSVRKDVLELLKSAILAKEIQIIDNQHIPSERMHYNTPNTLGVDRFLVANAAYLESGKRVIVIDAGSAITIDLMSETGIYMGGVIMAGLQIQKQAIEEYLPELPGIESVIPKDWPGKSSKECLEWGVNGALQFALNGFIKRYMAMNDNTDLYITGGDSEFIKSAIDVNIESRHRKFLLFDGMRLFTESME